MSLLDGEGPTEPEEVGLVEESCPDSHRGKRVVEAIEALGVRSGMKIGRAWICAAAGFHYYDDPVITVAVSKPLKLLFLRAWDGYAKPEIERKHRVMFEPCGDSELRILTPVEQVEAAARHFHEDTSKAAKIAHRHSTNIKTEELSSGERARLVDLLAKVTAHAPPRRSLHSMYQNPETADRARKMGG